MQEIHKVEFVFPFLSEAFPGGHPLQSVSREAPVADEYFPASHSLQVDSDCAELVLLHLPALHAVHFDFPVSSWYSPLSQILQLLSNDFTSAMYIPTVHSLQLGLPCSSWCLPGLQGRLLDKHLGDIMNEQEGMQEL